MGESVKLEGGNVSLRWEIPQHPTSVWKAGPCWCTYMAMFYGVYKFQACVTFFVHIQRAVMADGHSLRLTFLLRILTKYEKKKAELSRCGCWKLLLWQHRNPQVQGQHKQCRYKRQSCRLVDTLSLWERPNKISKKKIAFLCRICTKSQLFSSCVNNPKFVTSNAWFQITWHAQDMHTMQQPNARTDPVLVALHQTC